MAHATSWRSGSAGDETSHRLLAALLRLMRDILGGVFLGIYALGLLRKPGREAAQPAGEVQPT